MARYMRKTTTATPAPRRSRLSPRKAGNDIIHGRFISLDFFSRHWVAVAVSVLLLVWYITNKYECRTSMEQVKRLQTELEIARGEYVNQHSRYMSSIRETVMEDLARRNNLNLRVQDQPPYKLKYPATDNK